MSGPAWKNLPGGGQNEFHAVCARNVYAKANPHKKGSTWLVSGRVFEVMKNWADTIEDLPEVYNPLKRYLILTFLEQYLSKNWAWRADGNLNLRIALRYVRQAKKYGKAARRANVLLTSLVPVKIAELISTLNGTKAQVHKA